MTQRVPAMQLMRSWLFVPGNRPRMIQKAPALGADVIVYDLEDALPSAEKASGRRLVAEALAAPLGGSLRYVRVESDPGRGLEDARAVVRPGLEGL
ncbi:MAG: aldolase/citrate lyase family protein, partial [Acidobacteriota bacterium]|nr:aldolase/citrate lyase family protein [Acidobacteriota bacterium]